MTTASARRVICAGVAATVFALVGSGHADCSRTCTDRLAACKRTVCAGERGGGRRRCIADCRGRTGCGGGTGTLAYVVSTCHLQGNTLVVGTQELRVRRNGCDPVTVLRFANPEPVFDPFRLCDVVSRNHAGNLSSLGGVFQRLGLTNDGSGVVFEISNQFQLIGRIALAPEQQGFFYVRPDGTGLRRVGPPSRDPVYRIFEDDLGPVRGRSANANTELAFSPDNGTIVYTDVGPGMNGGETEQLFALALRTGDRRQLTRFDPVAPEPATDPVQRHLLWPVFKGPDRIVFTRYVAATYKLFVVDLDGTGARDVSFPTNVGDGIVGRIDSRFKVTKAQVTLRGIALPGEIENPDIFPGLDRREIFSVSADGFIQLTNFRRADTNVQGARLGTVLFTASADPFGTNPLQNCQFFRVSKFGGGLRQLTRFGTGARSEEACGGLDALPGCGITTNTVTQSRSYSRSFPFYSDCDPFGTNPDGAQLFAIDYDGSHLRQLTHTAGVRRHPDGSVEVEVPGPVAVGGR